MGCLKTKVIEELKEKIRNDAVRQSLSKASDVVTDDSTSYMDLKVFLKSHEVGEKLSWIHIAISNAKRQLLNSYHTVKHEFLQA